MSFTALLTHTATVKRLTATVGVQKSYQNAATGVACLIQPLDDAALQAVGMAYGKGFRLFADSTADIRESDELVDQDGNTYTVKGIKNLNYGSFPHLEGLLYKDKRV